MKNILIENHRVHGSQMKRCALINVIFVDEKDVLSLQVPGVQTFQHPEAATLGGDMEGSLIQFIDHQQVLTGVETNKLLREFLQAAELTGEMEGSVSFVIFTAEQEGQNGWVRLQPVQD